MKWIPVILVGVIFTVTGLLSGDVSAGSGPVWKNGPYNVQSKAVIDRPGLYGLPCGGKQTYIKVANYLHPQESCLYGSEGGVRVARFYNNQQVVMTVISFPAESQFYEIRGLCFGRGACVYSQEADKMYVVRQASYYATDLFLQRNLTQSLVRKFDPSIMTHYYEFTGGSGEYAVSKNDLGAQIGNVAVSRNGKWIAVEYANRGVIRVNAQTDESRRVYPLNSRDMRYELAITNDGSTVAMSDVYPGAFIITVDAVCGDRLVDSSTGSYEPYVQRCHTDASSIPGIEPFAEVKRPDFINNTSLYYQVGLRDGYYGVVITPTVSTGSSVKYVALGDSFTSGEGESKDSYYREGTNTKNNTCHVSVRSYPYLLPDIASYPTGVLNIACSGAVMRDVIGSDGYRGQQRIDGQYTERRESALSAGIPGVAPQLDFIAQYKPDRITVSIGGNDTGFMEKLKGCVGPGVCEWAKEGLARGASAREIDSLYVKYQALIEDIRAVSDGASVAFVGYPRVIAAGKDAACGIFLGNLLSPEERRFMDEAIMRLNRVMRAAVESAGGAYISIEDAYEGSKLCQTSSLSAMNSLRLGDDIAPLGGLPLIKMFGAESFHPTAIGHRMAAQAIAQQSLSRSLKIDATENDYWGDVNEPGPRYALLDPSENVIVNKRLTITLRNAGFAAGSNALVHFQDMGAKREVSVGEDGVLHLNLDVPVYETSGHKVVYISGNTTSNEQIIGYVPFEYKSDEESVSLTQEVVVREESNKGRIQVSAASVSGQALHQPLKSFTLAVAGGSTSEGGGVGRSVQLEKMSQRLQPKSSVDQSSRWPYMFIAGALALGLGSVLLLWWVSRRSG